MPFSNKQTRTLLVLIADLVLRIWLVKLVKKRAREIFFLGLNYTAQEAFEMGMVNRVVPHEQLEETALEWAHLINQKSPTAMRMLKFGFNLIDDGLVGQQLLQEKQQDLLMEQKKHKKDVMHFWKNVHRTTPSSLGIIDFISIHLTHSPIFHVDTNTIYTYLTYDIDFDISLYVDNAESFSDPHILELGAGLGRTILPIR